MRVGIIGLGKMGILHAGIVNALPSSKVTAICESEGMLTRLASRVLPGVSFYRHPAEMAEEGNLDAIFVASPIHTHVPIIRELLRSNARIGIFSEKPLATNGTEARGIADLARRQGVVNMVGFQKRFSPVLRHAKYLLEKRAIGRLQFMRCYSYASDIFRKGSGWRFKKGTGGVLLDLGPHLLDLLLWYFGEPEVISAIEQSYYSSEVEDYVHAVFRFGADFVGSFDVSWSKRHYRLPEISIEVQGTAGSLSVCDDYVRIQADKSVEGVIEAGSKTFQRAAFDTGVQFLLADPEYTVEDIHFLDAVQNRTKVEPDFQTAAEVSQLIDQVHQVASRSEC